MIGVSLPPDERYLLRREANEGERRREREREGEAERVEGEHSAEAKKAEFSIAQYEFSPVCGMQESICILLIMFPIDCFFQNFPRVNSRFVTIMWTVMESPAMAIVCLRESCIPFYCDLC
jgi:hypothetical protein